jgi:hypothetical protein
MRTALQIPPSVFHERRFDMSSTYADQTLFRGTRALFSSVKG